MAKKKYKFHKIIIHPNRYLVWALAVAVIVGMALVSYIYIATLNDAQTANSNISFWHTYKNSNLSFRYPADWVIDPGTGYVGFGPKDRDAFLVFTYTPANDAAYENYLKLPTTAVIKVGGTTGIRIADSISGQKIAFVKTAKNLYEFRGSTGFFDQIINTVKFQK